MRYQAFVRAAAGLLSTAFFAGTVIAQSTVPSPRTMTDTAPLPASDRSSVGAVILMDDPVLAQREAMMLARERSAVDTSVLGAGPASILRKLEAREELKEKKARDAATRDKSTPE